MPILAAQAASLGGFWNEQLPKLALLLLLVPPLAVTVSYWRAGLATAALLFIVWVKLAPMLTNGYMDGQLALYGLVCVLMIGSWLETGAKVDLAIGVLFIGVALGLKNEGSLFGTSLLVCLVPAAALAWRRGRQLLPTDRFESHCVLRACRICDSKRRIVVNLTKNLGARERPGPRAEQAARHCPPAHGPESS